MVNHVVLFFRTVALMLLFTVSQVFAVTDAGDSI